MFGTFRERIGRSQEYKGESQDTKKSDDVTKTAAKTPSYMRGGLSITGALPPANAEGVYMVFTALLGVLMFAVTVNLGGIRGLNFGPISAAQFYAFVISCGPILFGYFLVG